MLLNDGAATPREAFPSRRPSKDSQWGLFREVEGQEGPLTTDPRGANRGQKEGSTGAGEDHGPIPEGSAGRKIASTEDIGKLRLRIHRSPSGLVASTGYI